MCGAVVLFACNDAAAKYLNTHMHTVQVVWARYMAAFALAIVLLNPTGNPQMHEAAVASSSAVWRCCSARRCSTPSRLRYLQLDEAVSIIFCTPFIVAALGGPMLGEWIGWRRWTAIVVGFAGILLVTRPGSGGIHPAALLVVVAAICALCSILTRVLTRSDLTRPPTSSNLVGAAAITVAVPFYWSAQSDPLVIALMCSMGLFSGQCLADPGASTRAGRGARAVHLHRDRLDDRARLPGLRRRAEPLDGGRRRGHRVGALPALPRARDTRAGVRLIDFPALP